MTTRGSHNHATRSHPGRPPARWPSAQNDKTMNNNERSLWIYNDESLYFWWKRTRLSIREFIRRNRTELDKVISKRML